MEGTTDKCTRNLHGVEDYEMKQQVRSNKDASEGMDKDRIAERD